MNDAVTFRFGKTTVSLPPTRFTSIFSESEFSEFCLKLGEHYNQNLKAIRYLCDWFFDRQEGAMKACRAANAEFADQYQDPRLFDGLLADVVRKKNNADLIDRMKQATAQYDKISLYYSIFRRDI